MNKRIFFLSVLIFSIIASAFYSNVNVSYARDGKTHLKASSYQYDDKTFTVYQKITMLENAENKGTMKNISSIDINLGTSRWNATNIEFNITDMDFVNETKTIEDNYKGNQDLDRFGYLGLAVQMEILAPTTIYGVYIHGYNDTDPSEDPIEMYVQIQGSDTSRNIPNGTLIGSTLLNMSQSLGETWHLQMFPAPIPLSKGIYYLVLNGTNIENDPGYEYWWSYCNENPSNPHLYVSKYIPPPTNDWTEGEPGTPYLYKIIQKINADFYPEEINMTAEIDGIDYPLKDGNIIGTGNLTQSLDGFYPNTTIWNIPIKNNISEALIFNLRYYIKLNNSLSVGGSVLIRENLDNIWTIEPNLDRFGYNYTVKFNYSNHWSNLEVYKNGKKLTPTGNYSDDGDILEIFNNTIIKNTEWAITANSTNYEIRLDVPEPPTFNVGEKLGFLVESPVKKGNYTFILIDRIGIIASEQTKTITNTVSFPFNYTIVSDASSGEWTGLVFWYNETDAGVQTQLFQITGGGGGTTILPPSGDDDDDSKTTTEIDYSLVVIAVIITGLVIAGGFASLTAYKRVMKTRELKREMLHNQFLDAINLNYVMVIDKKSGLNVYEQFFAGKQLDGTLISGFLDAIRAFGIELTSSYEQSQIITLEYKDSKILMSEFKDFRMVFILKDRPSENFLKSVSALSYDIDREYGEFLQKFAGNLEPFAGIKGLIEHHLNASFISPLKIVDIEDIELSPAEYSLVQKAKSLMKQNKLDYFFTTFLMPEQLFDPKRTQLIFKLIEKKVFQPTDISFS